MTSEQDASPEAVRLLCRQILNQRAELKRLNAEIDRLRSARITPERAEQMIATYDEALAGRTRAHSDAARAALLAALCGEKPEDDTVWVVSNEATGETSFEKVPGGETPSPRPEAGEMDAMTVTNAAGAIIARASVPELAAGIHMLKAVLAAARQPGEEAERLVLAERVIGACRSLMDGTVHPVMTRSDEAKYVHELLAEYAEMAGWNRPSAVCGPAPDSEGEK